MGMNIPFAFPDWVPWWVPMVLLVPALLYALAFLFMPFSVLGVKTRLEVIEGRLDEIQQEIRHLALRLPVGPREVDFEDVYAPINQPSRREPAISDRPPIPPAARDLGGRDVGGRDVGSRDSGGRDVAARDFYEDDDEPVERPAPPPNMRPIRRQEPRIVQPQRSEPRLDGRR